MKSSEFSDNSFRERIVNVTRRRVGEIAHNERNPKQYTDEKQRRLNATLAQFGKAGVLLTYIDDDGTERFFDGNSRRNLDPDEEWYIAQTDLTQKEVDGLVLFYDALAEPDWSAELARVLIDEADVDDAALDGMLAELAAELGVKAAGFPGGIDPSLIPDADRYKEQYGVIIICEDAAQQEAVYNEMNEAGYNCKVVVT